MKHITEKLIHLNPYELTMEQELCVGSYITEKSFDEEQVDNNIYLDPSNGHLFIIIDDDTTDELIPTYFFYKDEKGNVWDCIGCDYDTCEYEVAVIVVEDDGHYISTGITWYMFEDEFDKLERIEVEVDKVW